MNKTIVSLSLGLLLTACGSQDSEVKKPSNSENKVEASAEIKKMDALEKKISTVETTTKTPQIKKETKTVSKPIFTLTTIEGKNLHVNEVLNGVTFDEYKNKIVLLIFFGHRCPPCLGEIPAIEKLVAEKGDKLEVIALEVQRLPEEKLKIFKRNKKINYTLLSGENRENSKFISYIAERANWTGSIPFLVGIAKNGEVGVVHVGGMRLGDFKTVFDTLDKQ